ncbi:MAG TPA: hypothetical protein VIV60_27470 [Polyangiaceae bacterium]
MLSEPLLVVARIAAAFDTLSVPYIVGGSLASSVYGIPRATQDVDLVAILSLEHIEPLTAALSSEFYVDGDMIADAIKRRASFNVVHLATMFKADVFVPGRDSWTLEELKRGRTEQSDVESGSVGIRFASPEDTLLLKLVWYKLGNEISERQWRDVLGIMKVQGAQLDSSYLDIWADAIDVVALLKRARLEISND